MIASSTLKPASTERRPLLRDVSVSNPWSKSLMILQSALQSIPAVMVGRSNFTIGMVSLIVTPASAVSLMLPVCTIPHFAQKATPFG